MQTWYKIRGSYPNYYILNLFADKGWAEFEKDKEPEGNKPGTIIYSLDQSSNIDFCKEIAEIAPRWYDVYFLLRNHGESADNFLRLLIQEEKGDTTAHKELMTIRQDFYNKCKDYVESNTLYDTEYVHTALSKGKLDIYEISHKGVMLSELMQAGYAVPDFVILSSSVFKNFSKNIDDILECDTLQRLYLQQAVKNMEIMTRCTLGSPKKPLILALRSTMPQYIPGLMPTILNAGITRTAYKGLLNKYDKHMTMRIYWNNLMNIYKILYGEECKYGSTVEEKEIYKNQNLVDEVEKQIEQHPKGKVILDDAFEQLYAYFCYIKQFYENNQDLLVTFMQGKIAFPSLILQKMVWTIGAEYSYPGVLYSRHSRTGIGVQVESYPDIFGEEIMTGNRLSKDYEYFDRAEIKDSFPAIYHFDPLLPKLEKRLSSPVTIEFGAEHIPGKANLFAVLQINESELTGRATLLSTVDLYNSGVITKQRVGELVRPYHSRQIFSERIDDRSLNLLTYFCRGINVLPRSAVSAKICFTTAKAIELKKEGEKVCLCKDRFIPEDTITLSEMDAIISMNPAAIHVVTACRGFGIPAFLSLEKYGVKKIEHTLINDEGMIIEEFDTITLSSKNATIYKGEAKYKAARFLDYLNGVKLEMSKKEEKVFIRMKIAYQEYTKIIRSIQVPDIVDLNILIKLIRSDLKEHPEEAKKIANNWFESNADQYILQLMESAMGSHLDQFRFFDLLSDDYKQQLFKKAINFCLKTKRSGLDAGSFMLGRFLTHQMPMKFWQSFSLGEIAFMLNEYILYEKYLNVLSEVGEQQITRARKRILSDEINNIQANIYNVDQFITLKLNKPNWKSIKEIECNLHNRQNETIILIEKLCLSYGELFDYNQIWSLEKLEEVCKKEGIDLPLDTEI